jgi:hypothetical protein
MMLSAAVRAHLEPGGDPAAFMRLDDSGCMQALLHSPSEISRTLAMQIYYRRLYKRALYVGSEQVTAAMVAQEIPASKRQALSAEIADAARVEAHHVLVDIPVFPRSMSVHVMIKNRHRLIGLEEISPLVTTLNETRRGQWRLGVYAPPDKVKAVGAAAREILHVRPFTTQDRLIV